MSETKEMLMPLASSNKESEDPVICELHQCKENEASASSLSLPEDDEDFYLDPKPLRPLDSDCCGSGCKVCVFDIFEKQLKQWKERCRQKLPLITHGPAEDNSTLVSLLYIFYNVALIKFT